MRQLASKLLLNWVPSAVATFIGGLALHLYVQPPAAPAASPKTEIVPAAPAPIAAARPNDAVPASAPEPARSSTPAAAKAATAQPKVKSAPQRSATAAATRKQSPGAAPVDLASRESPQAAAAPRLTAQEPTIGAAAPEGAAIVDEPSLAPVPIEPQPFSIAELKQRLAARLAATSAAEAASSEPPACDDRSASFANKRCAMKTLEASSTRSLP
jgi:hypothetical protein